MKPEVIQSSEHSPSYPASSLLILGGGEDGTFADGKRNFWLAEQGKVTGQGFTLRLDNCTRVISSVKIKNKGYGRANGWATKAFRVSGAVGENGPWQTLLEEQLEDTRNKSASLREFNFNDFVRVQLLKFDLLDYWGQAGGGLQYFAAILDTRKHHIRKDPITFQVVCGSFAENINHIEVSSSCLNSKVTDVYPHTSILDSYIF